MEASSPSGNTSEPPKQRWSELIGATIALVTLVVPLLTIAYYPASNNSLQQTNYNLQKIAR
jgi:hypothetical protein